MKHCLLTIPGAMIALALCAQAQIPESHIAESKQVYSGIKNNLVGMAEAMPESDYGFKPVPEIRSFGELMAHIADAQARLCSTASGQQKNVEAASKTSKADLVAALKESFAICDAAWDGLTPATAGEEVGMGRMRRSKLGMLEYNSVHSNEEYGYGAVYLRLKNIVPPSSARRSR